MAESVVSDEMRAAVGVETPGAVSEVTTSGIRMFARAVGYTDLIFYDEDAAKAQGHRGLVAPPGYLGTPIYRPASAGPSSPARVLNGGTSYEYVAPVIAGDVITSASKITEFREREGSRGRMLITYRETTFTNQDNVVVARMRGNGIQY